MATARTVRDLITASLVKLGVYGAGETVSAEDMQHGLDALQDLLAEWSDGGLMVPSVVQEAITLVVGQESYAVGENGSPDLDTVRPEQITGAFVRDSSDYDHPVKIISERGYQLFIDKSGSTARPSRLWYNPTAPNGTVYVWPPPSAAEALWISSIKPFTEPSSLTQNMLNDVYVPRNYYNPVKWNLTLEMAEDFGRPVTPTMIGRAQQGYNQIQSLTAARRVQPAQLEVDRISAERYSILTG